MAGGLLQLVAYGAQDLYLTGNPQITFFKVVYRRHTNFAIESKRLQFNGTPNFGSSSVCNIIKGPDLLHKLYLDITIDSGKVNCEAGDYKAFRWLNWLGHIILKKVSFNLGGTEIDKHDGEWYHLWNELSQNSEKAEAYAEMVGNTPNLTHIHTTNKVNAGGAYNLFDGTTESYTFKLRIPLQFWFTKSPGLALPIIALNHSDLSVEIDFRELDKCIWATHHNSTNYRSSIASGIFSTVPSFDQTYIYADYIYLDTDERKRFAQSAHEYLIEKVQIGSVTTKSNSASISYTMNFTHPVKELIWVIRQNDFTNSKFTQSRGGHQYYNYTTEFDYTGFTGTPEPYTGTGMAGGRRPQNLWHGLSGVTLPYYANEYEPDLSESYTTTSSGWYGDTNDSSANTAVSASSAARLRMGYDRVKAYHVDIASDSNGSTDPYTTKSLDRFIGSTSSIQNNGYTTELASNLTIPAPYLGNWGPSGNNTRLLDQGKNPVASAKIVLNGTDRISDRDGFYFNVQQPYDYHTSCPAPGINVYSFAFEPEEHQPSGSCNFSRIDNASIEVTLDSSISSGDKTSEMKVYAVSYNILRIMSGLGQLAYAN